MVIGKGFSMFRNLLHNIPENRASVEKLSLPDQVKGDGLKPAVTRHLAFAMMVNTLSWHQL
jgi:hypothetical protein